MKLDFLTNFKSNHYFTNSNIEVASCKFEGIKQWCVKIGIASKGPAALHHENKKYGLYQPPKIRGQYGKVIKLISRKLGNLIGEVLLEETADDFEKEIRERTNHHARKNHSRISVADEEAVAKAIDNSASAVLGIAKIDDGAVPEISTNPFMNYFNMPMDNEEKINK